MKIVFLNIYNGKAARGAETFVEEVANRLAKNHEVTVIQGAHALNDERYKVLHIDYDTSWKYVGLLDKETLDQKYQHFLEDYLSLHILKFTLKSIPYILKEKPQFVIPVNGRWQSIIVRLATWIYGGKMVISGQSGIGRDDVWNLWCMPNAFIALSTFAKKWASRRSAFIRVEYIPNGVDIQKFNPKGDKIEPIIKKPLVLFVGAFEMGKRPLQAIKAVSEMKKKANLLLVGVGNLRFKIEDLSEKLLGSMGERYSIKSYRHAAMPKVYRVADVFTIPSRSYYSFEIVMLEAMASGLPVITNDDPIRREIVGNAGLFVNPEDIDEYAQALDKALSIKWGDKPRKQAEKFSWDRISEQYEQLFGELVSRRSDER